MGYAFMDDTNIIDKPLNMDATYWQVAKNLQAAIHHWRGGIHASGGGQLSLTKCTGIWLTISGWLANGIMQWSKRLQQPYMYKMPMGI